MGFSMGSLFHKQSNNQTQTTSNWQNAETDNTINTQGPVAAGGSVQTNNTSITTLDAGAINAAATLVGKTIDANSTGLLAAYDLVAGLGQGAFKLSKDSQSITAGISADAMKTNANLSADAMKTNANLSADAMKATAETARDSISANSAAMRDAFAYSTGVNSTMAKTYDSALGMTKSISQMAVEAATDAAKKTQDASQNAVAQVASAWTNAKQAEANLAGGDYRQLMIIGAAIIGVVAIMAMRKG